MGHLTPRALRIARALTLVCWLTPRALAQETGSADAGPQPELRVEPRTGTEPGTETGPRHAATAGAEPETEIESEAASEIESEAASETERRRELGPEPRTGAVPRAEQPGNAEPRTAPAPTIRYQPMAQLRTRSQSVAEPYAFDDGAAITLDDYTQLQTRVRAGLQIDHRLLSIAISAQNVRNFGEVAPGALAGPPIALHEGYAQLHDGESYLRMGRQVLAFGDERLVGGADWSMQARSFDALRLHVHAAPVEIDLFASVVSPQQTVADAQGREAETAGDYLAGAYTTTTLGKHTLDVYLLYRRDGPNADDLARRRTIFAPGARITGSFVDGLDYTAEAVFQAGHKRSSAAPRTRQQALGLAGELRARAGESTTAFAGGSLATGDSAGSSWTELDNFYPTNRRHYGHANLAGWRNLREGNLGVKLHWPTPNLRARLAYHLLALAHGEARWSNAAGETLGQSAVPGSSFLGSELDAELRWQPLPELAIELGQALFMPAAGAERLGHSEPSHLLYLLTTVDL